MKPDDGTRGHRRAAAGVGRVPAWLAGCRAGLLLAALVAAGCGAAPPGAPRHLFLITVDTLRADHLGLYGYPRETSAYLDELAAGGIVFERAIAQWPATGSSFASVFTGRYPRTTGLTQGAAVHLPPGELTLAELLEARGFTTAAVVSNGVLRRAMGWDQGFTEYLQTWDLAPEEPEDPVAYREWLNARRVNQLALPLLERLRDAERLFVWLHYSDPHAPYTLPEGVENPFLGDSWDVENETVEIRRRAKQLGDNRRLGYYVAHYDANIRFADEHIGEVLDHARGLGLLEDALVVFTADHGESLGEHDYFFSHGHLPYNASAHVPLAIVRTPAGPTGRVTAPVELIDLFPTLRSLLAPELAAPGLEGDSLAPLLVGDPETRRRAERGQQPAFSQGHRNASVQEERWKLILRWPRARGRPQRQKVELYRLDADPMESRDLADREPGQVERLRPVLEGWMDSAPAARPAEPAARAEEESLKALRALGYVD